MQRAALVLFGIVGIAGAVLALGEGEARACGGCFHPPTQTSTDITDERMLLSVSQTQTTLYDQIQYSGSPTSFAWVLPIRGTVTVGLSADVLFDSVDALTTTTIISPPPSCPQPPQCDGPRAQGAPGECGGGACGTPNSNGGGGNDGVVVTKQQNVGPYATVQLQSSTPGALETWLAANGYTIPAAVKPVIAQYVSEGFDFLAMKLLPGQGIQAMRPVRVSSSGASLSLPLRMAAIGTGATVGITVWVVSEGRYEPQNFPFFHIADSELVWDWGTSSSNYTTLRAQHEATLNGKGWEIESSLSLAEQTIRGAVLSGGVTFANGGGVSAPVSDATADYLPVTTANGAVSETPDQVRNDDLAALFTGMSPPNVTVTRMRSDISHAAMTTDFVLQASTDQSELSNVRNVTKSINEQCPLYSGTCSVIGYGTVAESNASVAAAAPSSASGGSGCNAAASSPLAGPMTGGGVVVLLGLALAGTRRRRADRKS